MKVIYSETFAIIHSHGVITPSKLKYARVAHSQVEVCARCAFPS